MLGLVNSILSDKKNILTETTVLSMNEQNGCTFHVIVHHIQ